MVTRNNTISNSNKKGIDTAHRGACACAEEDSLCYVIVSSYTNLHDLAHQPKGVAAQDSLRVFLFNTQTGLFTLVFVLIDPTVKNVAFLRKHPTRNVLYAVTESIEDEGRLLAFTVCTVTGVLRPICEILTGGMSPCYITISYDLQRLFVVNYWNSTIKIVSLDDEGRIIPSDRPPIQVPGENAGKKARRHGDDPHGEHRGAESHAHALELDPVFGRVAYVPDLGDDKLKQFVLDSNGGLGFAGDINLRDVTGFSSSPKKTTSVRESLGPRYIKFHQHFNIAYLVNELASSVTVLSFDEEKAQGIQPIPTGTDATPFQLARTEESVANEQTLAVLQEISTIPLGFPRKRNTCGRVTMDPTGKFLLVSNRGHDSIAVFPVVLQTNKGFKGMLDAPKWYHIGGNTPRHFKFSPCGEWIFCSNQDSDQVAIFSFNPQTGKLSYKSRLKVPSPNFAEAFLVSPDRRQEEWVYSRL